MNKTEWTDSQYDIADNITLWLEERNGMYSPSVIARGVKVTTHEAKTVLDLLAGEEFVAADGNGAWRKYGSR